jgi:hypothetical protein
MTRSFGEQAASGLGPLVNAGISRAKIARASDAMRA